MFQARHALESLLAITLMGGLACHNVTAPVHAAPAALTQLPRQLTLSEISVRDAANAFSFALWGKVNAAQRDTNLFISPLSASFALGMAMNGAATVTYDQMLGALQFGSMSLADINAGYRSLIALLRALDPTVSMQIANSIWYRNGLPVLPSFLDTTRTYFDATAKGLGFDDVPGSLATINGWVNGATNGKIPKVLDNIDPNEVMFLINAIYFKGSWRSQFDPAKTASATFTTSAGDAQQMQLMHQVGTLPYAETATCQAVDLAYGDSAFTMTVLLPKTGSDIQSVAASLTPAAWQSLVGSLRAAGQVDLSLPKVTIAYKRRLDPDLMSMGMVEPFDRNGADFTRMAPAPAGFQLFIEFVQQNSFVDINEEGTEAAAVTTVGIGTTAAPLGPTIMRVDHPFIIVIRERLTGTVLFMGKVVRMPQQ
jgi:serine protease inhibitor